MKISYAIPVCNELVELTRLLNFLIEKKREEDEIVILYDSENGSKNVEEFLRAKSVDNPQFMWYSNPLNKDFAQQKNYLTKMCTGDWVFLIDADEYPDEYLCASIPAIVEGNPDVEAYWVSRINTVQGLTKEHVSKWGWNVDKNGWVNFPDRQMRLYKNELDRIFWTRPVHEQLVGYTKYASLPSNEEYCLHHPKDIKRQERQNNFYDTI